MIWCGELVTGLTLALGGLVPGPVADRVRAAIARTWTVGAEQIRIEWGRIGPTAVIGPDAAFRLFGGGRDGRFVVAVKTSTGGETAIGVRAGVLDSVWVAARPVPTGTRLKAADFRREERLVWGAPPPRGTLSPLGWLTERSVREGEPLRPPVIVEPPIIAVGDRIRFQWDQDGLRIVREGVATIKARRGDRVLARDPNRNETIEGIATGPGTARLAGKERP